MQYLVQYGKFRTGTLVEAKTETQAIKEAFSRSYITGTDYEHPVGVFPIGKGRKFRVTRELKIKEL